MNAPRRIVFLRTARQLFYILGEGLRAKLVAFHHGEIGKQFIADVLYRHTGLHCHNRFLDQFTGFCGYRLHLQHNQPD